MNPLRWLDVFAWRVWFGFRADLMVCVLHVPIDGQMILFDWTVKDYRGGKHFVAEVPFAAIGLLARRFPLGRPPLPEDAQLAGRGKPIWVYCPVDATNEEIGRKLHAQFLFSTGGGW